MKDRVISLELALLARKKRFNEACQSFYDDLNDNDSLETGECDFNYNPLYQYEGYENYQWVLAPTLTQLADWLADEKNVKIVIKYATPQQPNSYIYNVSDESSEWDSIESFDTEEDALESALGFALSQL